MIAMSPVMTTKPQPSLRNDFLRQAMLVSFFMVCGLFMTIAAAQETNAPPAGGNQKTEIRATDPLWTKEGFRSVTGAFIVGSLGAGAFFLGVFCGFISRESRERLLEFLGDRNTGKPKAWLLLAFCAFGGVVASVFQAAQASLFAPIQAFVLGATWPSVVTRIMSGNDQSPGLTALANAPASQIPTPKSGGSATAGDAQVVIKPKTP